MPDDDKYLLKADPGAVNAIVDKILDEHAQDKAQYFARRVTRDEVVIAKALGLYEAVEKNPANGHLHRYHARHIMGILNNCTDETLMQAALPGEILSDFSNPRHCFAQFSRIILMRRGVQVAHRLYN